MWGVEQPTHIVAEETVRELDLGLPVSQLVKPSALLMGVVHNIWSAGYGLPEERGIPKDVLRRIIYVGDDPDKDGELAANSGVEFIRIHTCDSEADWQQVARRLGLVDQLRFEVSG